jgi:predicted nuclease with TOPRIM domain
VKKGVLLADTGSCLFLKSTNTAFIKVEERLTGVETRLKKVEDEIAALGRKFQVFNSDILKLQNRDDDLAERMDKIEAEHTR